MIRIRPVLLLLAALAAPAAAAAQPDRVPLSRMDAFVEAMLGEPDSLLEFFPRRGTWAWVLTTRVEGEAPRVGRWRFDTADLLRAVDTNGPLCESFTPGGDAIPVHSLAYVGLEEEGLHPWRRAGATRFVPAGDPPRSPTFVQWRREDGRWVIDSFGNEVSTGGGIPWTPPTGPNAIVHEPGGPAVALPLPADAAYAGGTAWFVENAMLLGAGGRLVKYGPPRRMEGFLRRYGTVNGVGVYVPTSSRGLPDIVYVPVSPDGLFQVYEDSVGTGCSEGG